MIRRARMTSKHIQRREGAGTAPSPPTTGPAIVYDSGLGVYLTQCCALSLGADNFNNYPMGSGYADAKYCGFFDSSFSLVAVGSPSAANTPEPQALQAEFDGTEDLCAVISSQGDLRVTHIVNASNLSAIESILPTAGYTVIATIPSIFTFGGAGEDYAFDADALTGGVTLWGGDGAGGERT